MSQDVRSQHPGRLIPDVDQAGGNDQVGADGNDSSLEKALARFAELQDAGITPDREDFIAGYPMCAEELRACLNQMEMLRGLAQAIQTDRGQSLPLTQLGEYRLVRQIGRGGMGVVYEAIQTPSGHQVAVKVLPATSAFNPKAVQRFRNEIHAATMLEHPNIVNIIGAGCLDGVDFYAMRLIEGQTLAQILFSLRTQSRSAGFRFPVTLAELANTGGTTAEPAAVATTHDSGAESCTKNSGSDLSENRGTQPGPGYFRLIAELAIQALDGLEHAHQQGILHRDIKPSNFMLDASGHLWISDFGLARIERTSTLTETGDLLGTLRYMSPELLTSRHSEVDHRSDIFSLGATIYEAITLVPVVTGTDRADVIRQVTQHKPTPPRTLQRQIPTDLETILLKALAREREDRYSSCADMARDLRQFLNHRSIAARRPGIALKFIRWMQRNPNLAIVGFTSIMLLFIFGMLSMWWVSSARQQAMIELSRRLIQEQAVKSAQDTLDLHRDVSRTIVAAQAWQNADYGLLGDQMRQPGMDRDEFQLQLLRQYAAELPGVLATEAGGIYCVRVSPDGLQLATAGKTGVSVRDRVTGQLQRRITDHIGDVNSIAWSHDGTRLLSMGDDGFINAYSTSDWSKQFCCQVSGAVVMAAFAGASESIAFCERVIDRDSITCGENALHIANAADGTLVWSDTSLTERPEGLAIAPDGKTVAVVGCDGLLHIYSLESRKKEHQLRLNSAEGRSFQGSCVAFAKSQPLVVAGCRGEVIRVFNYQSGDVIQDLPDSHAVEGIAFSSDNQAIIAASRNGQLFMWEASNSGQWYSAGEFRCCQPVWTCEVLADGSIYTGGDEGKVEIVNRFLPSDRRRIRVVKAETVKGEEYQSALSDAIELGYADRAHDYASRRTMLSDRSSSEEQYVTAMSPAEDGVHWAVGLNTNELVSLFTDFNGIVTRSAFGGSKREITLAEFSSNGKYIFAATNDGFLQIDIGSMKKLRETPVTGIGRIINLAVSQDGQFLYLCHAGAPEYVAPSPIKMLDTRTLEPMATLSQEVLSRAIHHPRYTGDALRFLVSQPDEFCKSEPGIALFSEQVGHVAISRNNDVLALAHRSNTIRVYRNQMWQQPLVIHTGAMKIQAMDVSPDGNLIAVGDHDKIRLFHAVTGREFYELRTHLLQMNCLRFSRDGNRLLGSGRGIPDQPEIMIWGK
jgi:serine/threonine protein kinase/WD40 repeat protein